MPKFDQPPSVTPEKKNEIQKLFGQTAYYLNAGGSGTRLASILPKDQTRGITKALIKLGPETAVDYHVERAEQLEFRKIIIGAGRHQNVAEHLKNHRSSLEVMVHHMEYGTGGDFIRTMRLQIEVIPYVLIQNADTLLDVSEMDSLTQHIRTHASATIVLTQKKGVPNEGAYWYDENGRVLCTAESAPQYKQAPPIGAASRGSSTGMVIVNTELVTTFDWKESDGPISLYKDMLGKWVSEGLVYAYDNGRRFFKDIGTPMTYWQVPLFSDTFSRFGLIKNKVV